MVTLVDIEFFERKDDHGEVRMKRKNVLKDDSTSFGTFTRYLSNIKD